MRNILYTAIISLLVSLTASSCSLTDSPSKSSFPNLSENVNLEKSSFQNLVGWDQTKLDRFLISFGRSCERLKHPKVFQKNQCYSDLRRICQELKTNLNSREVIESNFTPYLVKNLDSPNGLFTGYYEAIINASTKETSVYKHPIYGVPKNTKHTRSEIEAGALSNQNLEILWTDDPIKLFFMHVQGSGKTLLAGGKIISIEFAGRNDHKYESIGKYLISEGYVEKADMSAQKIIEVLRKDEALAGTVMNINPSYIFFKLANTKRQNPVGSESVELTPLASIAIDKSVIPSHFPFWVQTTFPDGDYLDRLMVSQDTGSAIKGVVRADIFFGSGQMAEEISGKMTQSGKYSILIPKQTAPYSCF